MRDPNSIELHRSEQIVREIANPVEAIMNVFYLIEHDPLAPPSILQYVRMADSQVRCLTDVIQRVADSSQF